MRIYYSALILLFFSLHILESYSQDYLISQEGTVTTCSGNFYDSGGPTGSYSNDESFTMTFYPATSGAKLQFTFTSFGLESHPQCNKDYLRIHDGVNTLAPQIGPDYCGSASPGIISATNTAGALTFVFISNGSRIFSGWSASISCSIPPNLGLWTGTTSSDWNTPSNWSNNSIPTAGTDVTIPSSASNWPVYPGNLSLGTTCNNITMDGSSELTVTGNFTIVSGTALTCNANSVIHVGENFTNNGTFGIGTSTVDFYGTATSIVTGSGATWGILTDGFESNTGWTLTGEFQIGSPQGLGGGGGQNNPDPSSAYAGSNVLGVDLTGLGSNPGNYEPNLGDRAYQAISPTFDFSGYSNVSFSFRRWLGAQNFNQDKAYIDLSINNGSTWTNIWTNPAGAISETAWSLQSFNIPAADNQSQVKIRFCIGETNGNQQHCGWNIDEFQITGNVNSSVTFYNLTVSKANAELISNAHLSVINNAIVKPDAYMTNSSGKVINVGGNLTLEANASGMASYIDNGNTIVNGNTHVQQYLTSERWHLVSPPVSGSTINVYYDIYLKEYNEPTDTWTYLVQPTTIPMNVTQGYSSWASDNYTGPTIVNYSGILNKGNFAVGPLSYTPSSPNTGWNLIGNPYPSALQWNNTWIKTNVGDWACIHNNGNDECFNAATVTGWPNTGDMANGIIPPTQGFWIRATDAGASLTIPQSEKLHSGQAFYKNSTVNVDNSIRLRVDGNGDFDVVLFQFTSEASEGFDGRFDLEKRWGYDESPNIYSMVGENEIYSVDVRPVIEGNRVMPIGLEIGANGLYTIESVELTGFVSEDIVMLEDIRDGVFIQLVEGTVYTFGANVEDDVHRFNLHIQKSSSSVFDQPENNVSIYSYSKNVYIKSHDENIEQVLIYDMLGHEVFKSSRVYGEINRISLNTEKGYYIVKVRSDVNIYTEKVFIK